MLINFLPLFLGLSPLIVDRIGGNIKAYIVIVIGINDSSKLAITNKISLNVKRAGYLL